ncbi:BTAD domain-containing putative transcriptional regulator [Actinomadura rugatobispora]|uniref:BTAD domain-containing putative transcriptional regulator n=1 Tax=Actinomadura rugatobispora TaxID=1994 RepID=A0ABW1ACP8_9ACTN|nr:BTAD domain-containing putative transcriptional regulator [Actinomadura rugatobispora]
MLFGVLGPLAVWTDDGASVPVPGLKVRALLADLLLHEGRPVPADRLIDDLWGEDPPGNPPAALSAKVSQLRRILEDAEPGARVLVATRPAGYLLDIVPDRLDAHRFQALAARARETAAPSARSGLLAEALGLWRGAVLADFADEPFTQAAIARLEELRLTTLEDHAELRLELGEHGVLAGELGDLLAAHPLRERLRAAHMLALYRSGRQSEALESYEALRAHLSDELGLDPGAELAALHRSILTQAPELDAPPAGAASRPSRTNLQAPPSDLIGRDGAVAEIRARLGSDRLVTLTGPGGVGKTRLAVEAARGVDGFGDGVWMVELAAFERSAGAAELTDGILRVLDIRESAPPGGAAPAERLADALKPLDLLLVLDNCEHVVEQVADLARRLLDAVPGLRVLATSREPLGLAGEVVWNVPPLDVPDAPAKHTADPDSEPAVDVEELARSSAVRLFVERASAAARGFRLDEDSAVAVAVLCRRLDGIPLALELAATRVRALGVHGLVARLDDRFRLLATGHRGAPQRQRTLTAMIEWSWELLPEPERAVLRRLAVHADGCSLEAAEAVCAGDDIPVFDVLDLLARLVDRSLVVVADRADGPRYRLLESVAAYCAERLHEAGEHDEVLMRHRRYYAELAAGAEPRLFGRDQDRWLHVLDTEAANLRMALDGPDALRLANALTWYWFLRGRLSEALRSLDAALAADGGAPADRARAVAWRAGLALLHGGDDARWPARRREALAGLDQCPPRERARAQWFLAFAGSEVDDLASGEKLLEEALAAFNEQGDQWGEAAALILRSRFAHARGEPAALEREGERATRLFARLGDRWGQLQAAGWLAAHAELTGEYARADVLQSEALRMAEELHLWQDVALSRAFLGWIALQRGEYERARTLCEQAHAMASQPATVFADLVLGMVARQQGDADDAEIRLTALLKALPLDEGEHPPPFLPLIYVGLGYTAELRDDLVRALEMHREALSVALQIDGPRDMAFSLEGMASTLSRGGHPQTAARFLGAATAIRRTTGMTPGPSERGDIARTETRLNEALQPEALDTEMAQGAALTPTDCLAQAHSLHL